jgi:capsular exopolysaccharide synthesis family protein
MVVTRIADSLLGRLRRTGSHQAWKAVKEDEDLADCLVTTLYPFSAAAETYRILCANLLNASEDSLFKGGPSADGFERERQVLLRRFASEAGGLPGEDGAGEAGGEDGTTRHHVAGGTRVIMLTSSRAGEGTSVTCANLGVALAQADRRTLLLDANLLQPTIHKFFSMSNNQGIADVLRAECSLPSVCQEVMEGLKIVTGGIGIGPLDAMKFLHRLRFSEVLACARKEYDYVLVNAPPVDMFSAPIFLAAQADGVLLVLDVNKTRKDSVRRVMHSLEAVGANTLGTVVNNIPDSR